MTRVFFPLLFLFCLFSLVSTHSKKRKDEGKKIVKIIEFDKEEDEVPRRNFPRKHRSSSSSSSSWSSEEVRRGPKRSRKPYPFPQRSPRPQQDVKRNSCEDGWLEFERPTGVWCIWLGNPGITNGWFSQQDAQTACTALGATLTGYQNENERMTVANEALKKTLAMGRTVSGLWLGATNLPNCRSPSCGPFNTMQWTDGDTTGVDGIKWGVGEPDNNNWPGNTACIQQFIISPDFAAGPEDFQGWKGAFVNGDLDKYQCNSQVYPRTRLYACGKRGVKR
ncbi:hypothetical protein CAEBREN_22902 [Caenorhabditis brenneri]|uniref:C-type lectin domain-containing protein n=1 Tax=Caenorhabditis brenneri TaxID=135651 RepID=G0PFV9_CAEBE|nr:hypothetical protein CAEBREN_22902 [Caenorhabditis brenneri]